MDLSMLHSLEANPEFGTIPYSEQMAIRGQAFMQTVQGDPEFAALPIEEKEAIVAAYISRPPAFANSNVGAYFNDLYEKTKADPEALKNSAFGESFLRGAASNTIVVPALMKGYTEFAKSTGTPDTEAETAYANFFGMDGQNGMEYFRQMAEEGGAGMQEKVGGILGNILGFIPEFAVLKRLPIIKAAEGAMALKIGKVFEGSKKASLIAKSVLYGVAENTLENVALTARDIVTDAMTGRKADPLQPSNVSSRFWENAALDYAVSTAINVVMPFTKVGRVALREMFPGKGVVPSMTGIPADDLRAIVGEASQKMPKEILDQLGDRGLMYEATQKVINKRVEELGRLNEAAHMDDPFLGRVLDARRLGKDVYIDEGGGFNLGPRLMDAGDFKLERFTSLKDFNQRLVKEADTWLSEAKKAGMDRTWEDFPFLKNLKESGDRLQETWSSLKTPAGTSSPALRENISLGEATAVNQAYRASSGFTSGIEMTPLGPSHVLSNTPTGTFLLTKNLAEPQVTLDLLNIVKTMKKNKGYASIPDEHLFGKLLSERGYDGAVVGTAPTKIFVLDRKSLKVVEDAGIPSIPKAAAATDPLKGAFVTQKITKVLNEKDLLGDPKKLAHVLTGKGEVTPERIAAFTSAFVKDNGLKNVGISVKYGAGKEALVKIQNDKLSIEVPRSMGPKEKEAFINSLVDTLGGRAKGKAKIIQSIVKKQTPLDMIPGDSWKSKMDWVTKSGYGRYSLVQTSDKRFILRDSSGKSPQFTFATAEEAADYHILSLYNETFFRGALAQDGLSLRKTKDGVSIVDSRGNVLGAGGNFIEAARKSTWRPKRLPAELAPEVAILSNGSVEFSYDAKALRGSKGTLPEMLRILDTFEETLRMERLSVLKKAPDGYMAKLSGDFEVVLPASGIRQKFSSAQEASNFLAGGWLEHSELEKWATAKLYTYKFERGLHTFTGPDGKFSMKTKPELEAFMKARPDPAYAPPVFGADVDRILEAAISDHGLTGKAVFGTRPLQHEGNPMEVGPNGKPVGATLKALGFIMPPVDWLQRALRKTGDLSLMKNVQGLLDGFRLYRRDKQYWERIVRSAFTDSKGKLVDLKHRKVVYEYMAADSPEAKEAVLKASGFGQEIVETASRVKTILGETPLQGLYGALQLDPQKFLMHYAPRLRSFLETNWSTIDIQNTKLAPHDILQKAFNGTIPKEMQFFAENWRISDIVAFAVDNDMYSVAMRYVDSGFRKFHMNRAWGDIDTALKARSKTLDADIAAKIETLRESLQGAAFTDAEKALQRISMEISKKIFKNKADSRILFSDVARTFLSMNAFVMQAWKPWLVIRNMTQPISLVGPLVGNERLYKALKAVAKDPKRYMAKHKELGLLYDTPPIANTLIDTESLLGRIVHKGLAAFKCSDDITRCWTYAAVIDLWEEGVGKMQKGILTTPEELLKYTKAYVMPEQIADKMKVLVSQKKFEAAGDLFAFQVVQDTMFAYDRAFRPQMFNGLIGKLGGQFGIYAPNYVSNVAKYMNRLKGTDRAAYIAAFAGNAALLYGAVEVIGADGSGFLPWAPAQFTGGPGLQMAYDLVQSWGSGYQASISRDRLGRSMKNMVPILGSHSRSFEKAVEYSEQGDFHKAFLALTGMHVKD